MSRPLYEYTAGKQGDEHLRRTTLNLFSSRARPLARSLAASLAILAGLSFVPGPSPAGGEQGPFQLVGSIPQPTKSLNGQWMIVVDSVGRRLYTAFGRDGNAMIGTYTIEPEVPRLLSERVLRAASPTPDPSPYKAFLEPARNRLYLLVTGGGGENHEILVTGADGNAMATLRWPIIERLPGFFAGGMTYSPEDDRIYLVGEMSGVMGVTTATPTGGAKVAGGTPTVVALDPDDGSVEWVRAVPECRFPLYTQFTGSLIARSSPALPTPSLFFPCSPGGTHVGTNFPHQPGLTALRITPKASMADAQGFDVHFHPISGNFFNGAATGIAGYDYGSDRLFLQSLSTKTPAAWVFDAHADTWVGAITAPNNKNAWLGINQRTGHYYMGGRGGSSVTPDEYLLVADGRARRPQNGVRGGPEFAPLRYVFSDSVTDRLFVTRDSREPILVLKDLTDSVKPHSPTDYDAQTDDIPDAPDAFVAFSGDAGGFGARLAAVGDTAVLNGTIPEGSLPQASRAVSLARGPSTNLQPAGAAAAAEAAAIDTTTSQNLRDNPEAPDWPHGTETCLDGGEGTSNDPERTVNGHAAVTCNLKSYEAAAEAQHAVKAISGVTVADARHTSRSKRTVKDGITTETESTASGVRIDVPGAGVIELGKVTAKAIAVAHGQKGTASATWTRTIADVVVKDATGKPLFASAGCTSSISHDGRQARGSGSSQACDQLAEGVRRVLQVNVRLFFPTPEVVATPKGAFAGVLQSETDHAKEVAVNDQGSLFARDSTTRRTAIGLQVDFYHDSIERSRHIVQLAGVEATSVFTINRTLSDPDCATGGCIPGGSETFTPSTEFAETTNDGSAGSGELTAAAPAAGSSATDVVVGAGAGNGGRRSVSGRAASEPRPIGFVFARRSLGEGALMVAFLLLSAGAISSITRRGRLLQLLMGRS